MTEELVIPEEETADPVQPSGSMTLFGTDDPDAFLQHATKSAEALANVVKAQNLITRISNRDHVRVEGWTLLGSMLGVFPVCVWTRPLENGWEARVEARTRAGEIVGAAEAECLRSEKTWANRDDYALRSMAQTRATSKALRQPLGFVMSLAGFDATPAEEMPSEPERDRPPIISQPPRIDREKLLAEFKDLQPKLVRIDNKWSKDSVLAQASAVTGDAYTEFDQLPDQALEQLVKAGRDFAGKQTEFVAPEGAAA